MWLERITVLAPVPEEFDHLDLFAGTRRLSRVDDLVVKALRKVAFSISDSARRQK